MEKLSVLDSKSVKVSSREKSLRVILPVFKIDIIKARVSPTPILPSPSLSVVLTVLVTSMEGDFTIG